MTEFSCCKDGICKSCGKKLAECEPKSADGKSGCGAHLVLPDVDVSAHVQRFG